MSPNEPAGKSYLDGNGMVQLGGLEPPTSGSTIRRSNQLSYNCTSAFRQPRPEPLTGALPGGAFGCAPVLGLVVQNGPPDRFVRLRRTTPRPRTQLSYNCTGYPAGAGSYWGEYPKSSWQFRVKPRFCWAEPKLLTPD